MDFRFGASDKNNDFINSTHYTSLHLVKWSHFLAGNREKAIETNPTVFLGPELLIEMSGKGHDLKTAFTVEIISWFDSQQEWEKVLVF